MTNLTILSNKIRSQENLYSLNDLHIVSGGDVKHAPYRFTRLDTTQELIKEIENERSPDLVIALKSVRGGRNPELQGTWACEELVLSYAMWISPKFHLIVLRAFLAMHRNEPKQLALPEPEKKFTFEFTEYELEQLVWLWCGHQQMNTLLGDMIDPLDAIGSRFTGIVISHHHEYQRQYKATLPTIQRLIMPFKQSDRLNWTRAINLIKQ
ncbi:P22AR C-terminal domain-containing protein [Rodentibacter pneumotropicus]|uniref:P22AR C-terminal domain-containing protein n=1 Tax=Rodentibacter pneumotropicus TaxID=758 RepID=UPI00232B57F7|nr:P22AR C-terminal domain-containing protein [Rodentibacter pneumotropicus]MDC2824625.1 P22AR C-terminal domain-containing protein [Rodentibacter pneumotropicus]